MIARSSSRNYGKKTRSNSIVFRPKLNGNSLAVLERQREQLRYLFIVSAVTLEKAASANGTGEVEVRVEKAAGKKCDRCWNYSTHVGEDPSYPTVCERCSAVLKEIEAAAAVG